MTEEERRERRRAVARELHPDRGGDPAAFDRALRAIDETDGTDETDAPVHHEIVLTPSTRTRLQRRATAVRRTAAARAARLLRSARTTRLTRRAP